MLAHAGTQGGLHRNSQCLLRDHLGPAHVTDDDMRVALRYAVAKLCLERKGFPASRVGTHSLKAGGGGMALKLAGADRDNIKK